MELGLVWLVRAAWIAGILPIIIASIPTSKLNSFHAVVLGFANRGKTFRSSSQKFTVPQRFFCHFYVVGVVWTTLLLVTSWSYAYKTTSLASEEFLISHLPSDLTGSSDVFSSQKPHLAHVLGQHSVWCSVFMLLLMEVQVLRRLIESFYVFKYSPSARMHIFGYLTGLFFYTAAPLSLCCTFATDVFKFAWVHVAEFIVKGKNQKPALEIDWLEALYPLLKLGLCSWFGAAIFIWGWIHQRRCHAILGALRKHSDQINEYVLPRGDWFEIVSSPHYLAEIVIYAGMVVASGGVDTTIWLLFGFVVANLALAAAETHRWYLRKFENYPRNRGAIIPFVFRY